MHLVIGLGNPGPTYTNTRHNAGFAVVDHLARRCGVRVRRREVGALVARVDLAGAPVLLCKPRSWMNDSGQVVASLRGLHGVPTSGIIVVHDELELDFGTVRLVRGGGHRGHNGLRDIQRRLGGNDFLRVRVGVSRPAAGVDPADHVLEPWTSAEAAQLPRVLQVAADAVVAGLADLPTPNPSDAMGAHSGARAPVGSAVTL